jgi:hypothetical protein
MKGEKPQIGKSGKKIKPKSSSPKKSDAKTSISYEKFNRFVLSIKKKNDSKEPVGLIFKRNGIISWKLCAIRLTFSKDEVQAISSSKPSLASSKSQKSVIKEKDREKPLLIPSLFNKKYQESDFNRKIYKDFVWFNITWDTSNLKKPTRAIKGFLIFGDIFGEPRFRLRYTINDPLIPGKDHTDRGVGFEYNQFNDSHYWVRSTELKDMTFSFEITNIIYKDGTRKEF